MLFKDITLVDENFEVKEHMYLGIAGDTIAYVGDKAPLDETKFGCVYPASKSRGKLFIPGFVNAHSHSGMYLLRGYAENMSLMNWLNNSIFPFEAKLRPEDVYYSALMSVAEMLRFGIVSTTEMYMPGDSLCRAFIEGGVKANVCHHYVCFGPESFSELPASKIYDELFKQYDGYDSGRIKVEYCIHSEYTTTERVVRDVAAAAKDRKSAIHVHISETSGEVAQCRERHKGLDPVQYLAGCGVFDVPVNAAHCVHISDEDIAIMKEHRVSVASCPKSNLKLASGVCPASKLMAAGVNVALGTDSVASNNNLNMLEEIKFFALLHKGISSDPTLITPAQALRTATRSGAEAQRRFDCGLIKEGFKADLAAVDTDKIYMRPVHGVLNNLIYSSVGSDVFITMVDGKILYEDGDYKTIDVEKISARTEESRKRILSELQQS